MPERPNLEHVSATLEALAAHQVLIDARHVEAANKAVEAATVEAAPNPPGNGVSDG